MLLLGGVLGGAIARGCASRLLYRARAKGTVAPGAPLDTPAPNRQPLKPAAKAVEALIPGILEPWTEGQSSVLGKSQSLER